jgi:hypothetical protein
MWRDEPTCEVEYNMVGIIFFFFFFLFHHFITRLYIIHVSRTYGKANK